MSKLVIIRATDGHAVMDGSRACAVIWGTDPDKVRVYEHAGLAKASLMLFTGGAGEAYLTDAATWKTAQRILALLADGCWRDHDDLEEAFPGVDYCPVLEALESAGKVQGVYTAEYGDIFFRSDVTPVVEGGAQ